MGIPPSNSSNSLDPKAKNLEISWGSMTWMIPFSYEMCVKHVGNFRE